MSSAYVSLAWSAQLPPTPKLVLHALADLADDTGSCMPRIAHLAERVGVLSHAVHAVHAVHAALTRLEREGVLCIKRRPGLASLYRLYLPLGRQSARAGAASLSRGGAQ